MKTKTGYICSECGNVTAKWFGQCPSCKNWNTLEEYEDTTELDSRSAKKAVIKREKALSNSIDSIDITEEPRSVTGIGEFDRVLGGGIVKGSVTLLSGEPGIGKSTLLLQICDVLGKSQKVLYVSGEESPSQIKLRAKRLGVSGKDILIYAETDIDERERSFPMPSIFKSMLPAYGFYVRHADGVRLENVRLRYADGKEERPAVVMDDANASIEGCDFMPPKGNPPLKTIVTRQGNACYQKAHGPR